MPVAVFIAVSHPNPLLPRLKLKAKLRCPDGAQETLQGGGGRYCVRPRLNRLVKSRSEKKISNKNYFMKKIYFSKHI